jgi:hypothetical protein
MLRIVTRLLRHNLITLLVILRNCAWRVKVEVEVEVEVEV